MNIYKIYRWTKKAIRVQLNAEDGNGSLNQYQPGIDEDLSAEYDMDSAMRHGSHAYINDQFKKEGKKIDPPLLGSETRPKKTIRDISEILKKRFNISILLALFGLISINQDSLAKTYHIQEFNEDKNTELVSYDEYRLFLIYNQSLSIAPFDADGNSNGILDGNEVAAYNAKIEENIFDSLAEYFPIVNGRFDRNSSPVPLKTVLDNLNTKPLPKPVILTPEEIKEREEKKKTTKKQNFVRTDRGLYIRRSGVDISIRNSALNKASAELNYSVDNNSDVDIGRISGAVGYLFSGVAKPLKTDFKGIPVLDEYTYGGSVEIDRTFDSRGRAFETDNLIFRFGGDLQFSGITAKNIPTQYLSNYLRYETDSRFESSVLGIESVYEGYFSDLASSKELPNGNNLNARLVPTLRSDYTNVDDDPNNKYALDEFWNLGFGLDYRLSLRDDNKRIASFTSSYEHFWDVLGSDSETYNWTNQLQLPLANTNDLAVDLTATHRLSNDETRASRINRFELGIGVKY